MIFYKNFSTIDNIYKINYKIKLDKIHKLIILAFILKKN